MIFFSKQEGTARGLIVQYTTEVLGPHRIFSEELDLINDGKFSLSVIRLSLCHINFLPFFRYVSVE
jgi:hypothetical protein